MDTTTTPKKSRKVKRPFKKIPVFFPVSVFKHREGESAKEAKKRILSAIEIGHKQISKETLKKLIGAKVYSYWPLNEPKKKEGVKVKSADLKALLKLMDYSANSPASVAVLWRLLVAGCGNTHRIRLETIAKDTGLTVPQVRKAIHTQGLFHLILDSANNIVTIKSTNTPGTYKPSGELYGKSKSNVTKIADKRAAAAAKRAAKAGAQVPQVAKPGASERIAAAAAESLSKNDNVDLQSTKEARSLSGVNDHAPQNEPTGQEVAAAFAKIFAICATPPTERPKHKIKARYDMQRAAALWIADGKRQAPYSYYLEAKEKTTEKSNLYILPEHENAYLEALSNIIKP